eukprot:gnl/TRDRNA2_/TRDRNA2_186584_c0_seq1.p1 gnl/TRDRNA2_/TRDRNA2_186584_c0~~gnl/TRDRNA2_/TRDRNA2_186584_c0_seq1.p1  ORF type:complete len:379 (-),score=78.36 gnl/TRDRNA2_/TRDRNA2_186584_c0_seq1:95-1231(-)
MQKYAHLMPPVVGQLAVAGKSEMEAEGLLDSPIDGEPTLEVTIVSADLNDNYDWYMDQQLPFVEVWADKSFIGDTDICLNDDGKVSEETSRSPVWNTRITLRARGARFYRLVVCIENILGFREHVGEAGFAAADAWRATEKGAVALSVQIRRRDEVRGVLRLVLEQKQGDDDGDNQDGGDDDEPKSVLTPGDLWRKSDLIKLGKSSATYRVRGSDHETKPKESRKKEIPLKGSTPQNGPMMQKYPHLQSAFGYSQPPPGQKVDEAPPQMMRPEMMPSAQTVVARNEPTPPRAPPAVGSFSAANMTPTPASVSQDTWQYGSAGMPMHGFEAYTSGDGWADRQNRGRGHHRMNMRELMMEGKHFGGQVKHQLTDSFGSLR